MSKRNIILYWISAFILLASIAFIVLRSKLPNLPDWVVIIFPALSIGMFIAGTWAGAHQAIETLGEVIEKKVNLLADLAKIDREIMDAISTWGSNQLVSDYLIWTRNRYKNSLDHLPKGQIAAPNPEYFDFAEMVFRQAQKRIQSTSIVDPAFYSMPQCYEYIKFQVDKLIKMNKAYTRYFIVSKSDHPDRKKATLDVIRDQVSKNFDVAVVLTNNYEKEYDVAIIDDGIIAMEATVLKDGPLHFPEAQIIQCVAYLSLDPLPIMQSPQPTAEPPKRLKEIKGYFAELDRRVLARFSGGRLDNQAFDILFKEYI
jgi:hypothetical protein